MKDDFGKIIHLCKIVDRRGNLTVAEQMRDIPFEVKRVYWTYDVPAGRVVADMHISNSISWL